MILRALLALLFACLAVPALAMPVVHAQSEDCAMATPHKDMAMAMDHRDHAPAQPDKTAPTMAMQHGCIGCIPPSDDMGRALSPLGFTLALRHAMPDAAAPPARASAPETPPPKTLA